MSTNIRWVILSYGIFGIMAVYVISKIVAGIMGVANVEDPLAGYVPLATLLGLVGGIGVFVGLMKHPRATDFGLEVVKEVRKVSWPTVPETRAATIVVIILVIIVGFILGIFDFVFSSLTNLIYS